MRSVVRSAEIDNKRVHFDPLIETHRYTDEFDSVLGHPHRSTSPPVDTPQPLLLQGEPSSIQGEPIMTQGEQLSMVEPDARDKARPKLILADNRLTIDKNLSRVDIRRRKRNMKKLLNRNKKKKIHPITSVPSSNPVNSPPVAPINPTDAQPTIDKPAKSKDSDTKPKDSDTKPVKVRKPKAKNTKPVKLRRSSRKIKPTKRLVHMAKTILTTLFPKSTLFDNYELPSNDNKVLEIHLQHIRRELLEQHTFQSAQNLANTSTPATSTNECTQTNSVSNEYEQKLYSWHIDMMNSVLSPDPDDKVWQIRRISSHRRVL